jgi:hypothetical protein
VSAIGKASPVALGGHEWGLSERTPAVRPLRRNWRDGDAIVVAAHSTFAAAGVRTKLRALTHVHFVADAAAD